MLHALDEASKTVYEDRASGTVCRSWGGAVQSPPMSAAGARAGDTSPGSGSLVAARARVLQHLYW